MEETKGNSYILTDHKKSVNILYKTVRENDNLTSYRILDDLFSIRNETKVEGYRKRGHNDNQLNCETMDVQEMYRKFLIGHSTEHKSSVSEEIVKISTSDVRELARKLFMCTSFDHLGINGGNTSEEAVKCSIKGDSFLIPGNSRFYCGCVKEQCKKLSGQKFDILIADPPWWNKYIRRLKNNNEKLSYSMMYNEDIACIPVAPLLAPRCLVAVWCTNARSHIDAIRDVIFPSWGVSYITTWYWLKVSVNLEPICPFSFGSRKQPYERILIGRVAEDGIAGSKPGVPQSRLIVSVPSALHSHKPPLLDILAPFVEAEKPQVLELFARYLMPQTTSFGFQVLKFQHESLYQLLTYNKD